MSSHWTEYFRLKQKPSCHHSILRKFFGYNVTVKYDFVELSTKNFAVYSVRMKTKKDVVIKPDEYLSSVEGNGLKLLYLTSYWTYELDHILLNYLEGILNQITISKSVATIQLPVLLTFQMERFSSDTISSDNTHYENYCTKILPNGCVLVCVRFFFIII
jgi:hypothetical protein